MALTDMIALHAFPRGFSVIELLMVVAVGATLMAVGTPVLRGAMAKRRLRAGAADVGSALSEAPREAFRTRTLPMGASRCFPGVAGPTRKPSASVTTCPPASS